MIVLITGGAGFIGYHLAIYHIKKGDRVVIMDNCFKTGGKSDTEIEALKSNPQVQWIPVDLTQSIQVTNAPSEFEIVYHMAAINGTELFYKIPYQVARSNLLITINLLDWLEGKSVRRLVYSSTSEVYADCGSVGLLKIPTAEDIPVIFSQPTHVRFSYGTSKFMSEFLCLNFTRVHATETTVVRYHNIYGPRMGTKHVIPQFIERMTNEENPFRIYGGKETRAFCHVDDAVEGTHRVAQTPACKNEIIHIGNSTEEITIDSLARLMMEQFGKQFDIVECGGPGASVSRRCPDTSKLKRLTRYEAKVNLKEGLSQTINWYRKHTFARRTS